MITSAPIENLMREALTELRDSKVLLEWWPIVLAASWRHSREISARISENLLLGMDDFVIRSSKQYGR